MSSHSDSCKQLSLKSNPGTWLSHLIIEWHQQSSESTNRCCHDIIHCIIQWEAQQEKKPSIKQQTQNAALQRRSKLSSLCLKQMPHRASVRAVSSQLGTSQHSACLPLPISTVKQLNCVYGCFLYFLLLSFYRGLQLKFLNTGNLSFQNLYPSSDFPLFCPIVLLKATLFLLLWLHSWREG